MARLGRFAGPATGRIFPPSGQRPCAAGVSSCLPGKCTSAARDGARPMPTSAKRSTFAEYYATGGRKLASPHGVDVPGEENRFQYVPRGVTAVIAPWNFPLAILTGMTTAALVTGNTVVMKPAEQSPVVAAKLMEIFTEIGLPHGRAQLSARPRRNGRRRLVEHPRRPWSRSPGRARSGLRFTPGAARSVGRRNWQPQARDRRDGGKNAIIVDDDADLDEAVLGVMESRLRLPGAKVLGLFARSSCCRAFTTSSSSGWSRRAAA